MDIRQVLRVAKRWWWLAVLPVIVVGAHIILTFAPPAPTYQVVLRFTTGSEPVAARSPDYDRYYAWLASEYIANGLADLAVTSRFSERVAAVLADQGLNVPSNALQGAIVTDNAQSVLVVYLTWPDPHQAVTIAATIGQELLDAGPIYYPQMADPGSVARMADTPVAVPLPASLRAQLLAPLLRLAIAAAAGGGLVLLAHYIDPWVRGQEDLSALGLDVLGTIPRRTRWRA
jgi:capsular polysaccharide biosynthesis protein